MYCQEIVDKEQTTKKRKSNEEAKISTNITNKRRQINKLGCCRYLDASCRIVHVDISKGVSFILGDFGFLVFVFYIDIA